VSSEPAAGDLPPIITLWETYGAGMLEIGTLLAERLGIPLNQQLYSAEQLDAALAVREQEGLTTRVLGAFATFADEASDPGPNLAAFDHDDRVRSLENTAHVKEFSAAGGVIMGHDATVILAGRPNTLAVKLDGPVAARIAHEAARTGIDEARSARRQRIEDLVRPELSMRYHSWDPRQNDRFDLVLNTTMLSYESCVEIILAALRAKTGTTTS